MKDIPFPGLREQLQKTGDESLMLAKIIRYSNPKIFVDASVRRVALVDARPAFRSGTYGCAEIGEAMARAVVKPASRALGVFRLIKGKAISTQQTDAVIKTIADSGSNIVFTFNGDGERTLSPS